MDRERQRGIEESDFTWNRIVKRVSVVLSREANECFNTLSQKATCSKLERGLVKAILAKAELIKANPHYGQPISKKLIPKE